MAEDSAEIQVTSSRPYAVLLWEWLSSSDTARALAQGSVPLDDLGAKLALDHLARQLHEVPAIHRGQWRPKVAAARAEVEDRRRRQLHLLVKWLLDPTIDIGTRDDCAMDLGDFDDDEAFEALKRIASDPQEDRVLLASAGESLGDILRRHPRDGFDADTLTAIARSEFDAAMQNPVGAGTREASHRE